MCDKLHLGCGDVRIPGHLNIDSRETGATDRVMDCTKLDVFPDDSFSVVYSRAFFEHVYFNERVPLLQGVYRMLKEDGAVIFIAIPDFRVIALAYLGDAPGIVSPQFDLLEAYRYTHGAPEGVGADWWLEQLHKTLFDKPTVETLLDVAGFPKFCIFNYCYMRECIPLNIGFVAFKRSSDLEMTNEWLADLLAPYDATILPKTLDIAITR